MAHYGKGLVEGNYVIRRSDEEVAKAVNVSLTTTTYLLRVREAVASMPEPTEVEKQQRRRALAEDIELRDLFNRVFAGIRVPPKEDS